MRGHRAEALQAWATPYKAALRGLEAYFSLEQELGRDFRVTFWVERHAWANHLFAQAIGRA